MSKKAKEQVPYTAPFPYTEGLLEGIQKGLLQKDEVLNAFIRCLGEKGVEYIVKEYNMFEITQKDTYEQ